MKFKTTKKEMNSNFNTIISIGYCNAQYLLKYQQPIAYSTRAEGWACDYYEVDNVLISTGYAPITPKNSKINYDMLKKYDDRACEIACDWSLDYQEKCKRIEPILKEFIKEAVGGKNE